MIFDEPERFEFAEFYPGIDDSSYESGKGCLPTQRGTPEVNTKEPVTSFVDQPRRFEFAEFYPGIDDSSYESD